MLLSTHCLSGSRVICSVGETETNFVVGCRSPTLTSDRLLFPAIAPGPDWPAPWFGLNTLAVTSCGSFEVIFAPPRTAPSVPAVRLVQVCGSMPWRGDCCICICIRICFCLVQSGGGGEQPGKRGLPPAVDIRSPDIGTSWLDPLQRTSSLSDRGNWISENETEAGWILAFFATSPSIRLGHKAKTTLTSPGGWNT